ncbi:MULTISPECIES: NTF2-like N-terminal transpeptidase domain-containing protein [unclassified Gordonia (in: high G+C Gram-positive bacteria)]
MGSRVKWAALAACVVVACAAAFGIKQLVSNHPDTGSTAAMNAFAAAWSKQDAATAASYTTAPGQASEALTQTFQGMNARQVDVVVEKPVEYSDGTASFSLRTTWTFDKDHTFTSTSNAGARNLSTGWKITWEPAVIAPGLPIGGSIREVRTEATPAPTVNSRSGKTLLYLQPVNEIILDPTQTRNVAASARQLAVTLQPIAPLVTADVINQKLAETPGKAITAVTLRDSDMGVMTRNPSSVPGVTVRKAGMLVMADRRLNSPLEAGLTNYWQAIRDATAGWQVQMVGPGMAPRRLDGEQGPPGADVETTVDQGVQLSLGDAAVEVGQPATIMALDATTGGILGVAQNSYAADRAITLDTAYPVGTTLDPVLTAVDRSARDAQETPQAVLDRLGLGVQFTVPGASTPTSGPGVATIDLQSETSKMSMTNMAALGVAMARSSTGTRSSVAPFVIKGVPTKVVGGALGDLGADLTKPIWQAMTTTAKTGDASDLTGAPGLRALVGTNGPEGPGWFVGVQGGKVIVIYTEGPKSGTAALQVAQKYFRIK